MKLKTRRESEQLQLQVEAANHYIQSGLRVIQKLIHNATPDTTQTALSCRVWAVWIGRKQLSFLASNWTSSNDWTKSPIRRRQVWSLAALCLKFGCRIFWRPVQNCRVSISDRLGSSILKPAPFNNLENSLDWIHEVAHWLSTLNAFQSVTRHTAWCISLCYGTTLWWRGSVVERRYLAGELSLSCARPAADGWPLMWVSHPLQVSQLSLSSFRGR